MPRSRTWESSIPRPTRHKTHIHAPSPGLCSKMAARCRILCGVLTCVGVLLLPQLIILDAATHWTSNLKHVPKCKIALLLQIEDPKQTAAAIAHLFNANSHICVHKGGTVNVNVSVDLVVYSKKSADAKQVQKLIRNYGSVAYNPCIKNILAVTDPPPSFFTQQHLRRTHHRRGRWTGHGWWCQAHLSALIWAKAQKYSHAVFLPVQRLEPTDGWLDKLLNWLPSPLCTTAVEHDGFSEQAHPACPYVHRQALPPPMKNGEQCPDFMDSPTMVMDTELDDNKTIVETEFASVVSTRFPLFGDVCLTASLDLTKLVGRLPPSSLNSVVGCQDPFMTQRQAVAEEPNNNTLAVLDSADPQSQHVSLFEYHRGLLGCSTWTAGDTKHAFTFTSNTTWQPLPEMTKKESDCGKFSEEAELTEDEARYTGEGDWVSYLWYVVVRVGDTQGGGCWWSELTAFGYFVALVTIVFWLAFVVSAVLLCGYCWLCFMTGCIKVGAALCPDDCCACCDEV
eukprot:TRINITY_DN12978_c0_g1_i1.p1 TRINITY_DN12978_c0_g1~~TRINITY_DN12978_c0_g1_i1.p1  ORF type:complete len:509 (-),score=29.47 TRINITY_DN12978_c0_g1_i1:71-1597(-)